MITLSKKILKDHWLGIAMMGSSLLAYSWFLTALYPSIIKSMNIDAMIKKYPPALKAFFGGSFSFSTFEGYLNVEYFSLMLIIFIAGFLITYVTSELTKEVETGTIETLLSLPLSRLTVIFTKWFNMVLITIFLTLLAIAPLYLLAGPYDVSVSFKSFYLVTILSLLFFLAIGSFTMALSVLFNERSKALFIPIAILSFSYIWNAMGNLVHKIGHYRYLSVFYFYDTARAMTNKQISYKDILFFSIVILLSTAFTFIWFKKRDFAV